MTDKNTNTKATSWTLADVAQWARETDQPADAVRGLLRVPARLGLIDADLGTLPADLAHFERAVAGRGHALVSRSRDVAAAGRREDSRVRALLGRFLVARGEVAPRDAAVRARYDALIAMIAAEEGVPGSGKRWNVGRHRSLTMLRARAACPPEALTQDEVDRIGRTVSADKRKALRKGVDFLNALAGAAGELPALRPFLPPAPLAPPAGSSRARRMDWSALPAPFRASFECAAEACLEGPEEKVEAFLARIEAGEDPDAVMAEADAAARGMTDAPGKPTAARTQYREAVTWLVRAFEDAGGDPSALTDVRQLFDRPTLEAAITSQIARSEAAPDLRDPLASQTLKSRLVALATLAGRGLEDGRATAVIRLLRARHYDTPRARRQAARGDEGVQMEVDRIFAQLRQRPALAAVWANAPQRIAEAARVEIEAARAAQSPSRELTALRRFAGAAAYALQLSRPMRTACLRHARIASQGDAHAHLVRTAPGRDLLTFRFAPWEIKNSRAVTVDVAGSDAAILREWIERWRPRLIALQGLDAGTPYLFPGAAIPKAEAGNPIELPRGCLAPSVFLELWRDASAPLGVHETPHRMRHVVALLILARHPGDYARVAAVLGITQKVAARHYGRDDGEAAARAARTAILAAHPDLFATLDRRRAA